ncbi:hypothetical protein JTE90_014287 [Oedothorax gibbosus]|nr:hypothetical protein JTE90_014287 [Oedothorax gibbosus]
MEFLENEMKTAFNLLTPQLKIDVFYIAEPGHVLEEDRLLPLRKDPSNVSHVKVDDGVSVNTSSSLQLTDDFPVQI